MSRPLVRRFRPDHERLEDIRLLSGLTPVQVNHAYGLDVPALAAQTAGAVPGAGQTIAIVDAYHDPYLAADLKAFNTTFHLPAADLTQVFNPRTATNDNWAEEEALDVEWVHAIAPGAKIVVVEAATSSLNDLLAAVDTARNTAGVSVVAMSWGTAEIRGQQALDSHFVTPAGHTGITFLAATGDSSAAAGASWPSSSANVVAVGGTTLNLAAGGAYGSESAWKGGGGGPSRYVTEPAYQQSVQKSGFRQTPDVAIDADPVTGYQIVFTPPSTGRTSTVTVGGTSASAQVWAALIAIADQSRALAGKTTLDGPTQTLPALYSLPAADFHDTLSGSNGYAAVAGYDMATGRGTPVVASVIRDLAAFTVVPPVTQSPATVVATRNTAASWSSFFGFVSQPEGETPRGPNPGRGRGGPAASAAIPATVVPQASTVLTSSPSSRSRRHAADLVDSWIEAMGASGALS